MANQNVDKEKYIVFSLQCFFCCLSAEVNPCTEEQTPMTLLLARASTWSSRSCMLRSLVQWPFHLNWQLFTSHMLKLDSEFWNPQSTDLSAMVLEPTYFSVIKSPTPNHTEQQFNCQLPITLRITGRDHGAKMNCIAFDTLVELGGKHQPDSLVGGFFRIWRVGEEKTGHVGTENGGFTLQDLKPGCFLKSKASGDFWFYVFFFQYRENQLLFASDNYVVRL